MPLHKTYNDLVGAMAKRAHYLANLKLDELRSTAGYGVHTQAEAIRHNKESNRGELIEQILTEEFLEDDDVTIEA